MAGLNKIMVIGHLGNDPEMRYTPNGNAVTSFRIAVSRTFTSGGERREETEWFTVSAWNQLAEICNQYLQKGRQVYVEGRLKSREWTGNDGQTRFNIDITASDVVFLGPVGGPDGGGAGAGGARGVAPEEPSVEAEDLPW